MSDLLDPLLKSVSRSFYLSLRVLPAAIRPAMSVGYLLCRAADTVADTDVLPAERRLTLLNEIREIFTTFPLSTKLGEELAATLRESITATDTADGVLVSRLQDCLAAFDRLSATDRALVQRVVVSVATGMEKDLRTFGTDAETVVGLASEDELEAYIGWIGGEPGRFWTDVCTAHSLRARAEPAEMRELGFRFGKGLQMVNILRDLPADIRAGRCYLPLDRLGRAGLAPQDLRDESAEGAFRTMYHEFIDETIVRLESGLLYAQKLPRLAVSLRAAVWWPLALALRTLALLRGARSILGEGAPGVKVPRREVYWLMATSAAGLPFNGFLRGDFNDLAETASSASGFRENRA